MNKIFGYILTVAVCLVCVTDAARADSGSEAMLDALAAKIKSIGAYKVQFSAAAESTLLSGEYIVSGSKFYTKVPGIEVICDGRQRYEINHELLEIAIDNISPGSSNILSNPVGAFEFANSNFNSTYGGSETIGGKSCDIITLTPRDKSANITRLILTIDKASGLPRSLEYFADGIEGGVLISVSSFTAYSGGDSIFVFDAGKYPGYEVTDFR